MTPAAAISLQTADKVRGFACTAGAIFNGDVGSHGGSFRGCGGRRIGQLLKSHD